MAGRVQPSPLGGSTSAEEATSAVLSLSRLKKRRVKSRLRFNESVVRHQYSYGNLETGEAGEELSTSEEALKEHSDLSGWIHLWNELQGENREFIELNMSNFHKLNWVGYENNLVDTSLALLPFLEKELKTADESIPEAVKDLFGPYVSLKALNAGMDIPNTAYRNTTILSSLFRRCLGQGSFKDVKEILDLVAEKGEEAMAIPNWLNKVEPVDADAYKTIMASAKQDGFRQHDWSGLLAFFGEPLELYVKERTAYRERYLKFLHEGISHALLDSNVILARRLHKLKIPLDFDTALIVNGDQCKVKKVVIPDNLYDRAEEFGRSAHKLFIKLIRLGAEDVVLDWIEDREHSDVLRRKFEDGQCYSLRWAASNARVEVFKYPENGPNKKAYEKRHWGLTAKYELVTPLQCAMEAGNSRLVDRMLERGANPFQQDNCTLRGLFSLRYALNSTGGSEELADKRECKRLLLAAVDKRLSTQREPEYESSKEWWNTVQLAESVKMGSSKYMRRWMGAFTGQTVVPEKIPRRSTVTALTPENRSSRKSLVGEQELERTESTKQRTFARTNSRRSLVSKSSALTGFYGGSFNRATWTRSLRFRTRKGAKSPEPGTTLVKVCTIEEVVCAVASAVDTLMKEGFMEDCATNSHILRGIGILLKHSRVFLNKSRYRQIGDIVLKAFEENKGGDQDALIYVLFDCELFNILLNKNRIQSNSKYVKPIATAINSGALSRSDVIVVAARKKYRQDKSGSSAMDGAMDKAMRRDGHAVRTMRTLRGDLKMVDMERENPDFKLDDRLTERTVLLLVAKHGLYKLFLAYQFENPTPMHIGLAETMIRCAITYDQTSIVERLLETGDHYLLPLARKTVFDSGLHQRVCDIVLGFTIRGGHEEVEQALFDLFTSTKASEDTTLRFLQHVLPDGTEAKLPAYFTQAVSLNALERAFHGEDDINPKAMNKVLLESMFISFPDIFTADLLEACVSKLLRLTINGSKTSYYMLFQTLYEGCHEEIGSELAENCRTIESWAPAEDRGYASDDQVSPFL